MKNEVFTLQTCTSHLGKYERSVASSTLFVLSHFTLQHSIPPSAGRTKEITENLGQNIRVKNWNWDLPKYKSSTL